MKTLIINLLLKFITPENIATVLAKIICNLLKKASKTKNWDSAKYVVNQAQNWINLFNEVYEDEDISAADEEKIAQEIGKLTTVQNIESIIRA